MTDDTRSQSNNEFDAAKPHLSPIRYDDSSREVNSLE